ncbi:hypothetical protein D3C76_856310 [compost metagenome]
MRLQLLRNISIRCVQQHLNMVSMANGSYVLMTILVTKWEVKKMKKVKSSSNHKDSV